MPPLRHRAAPILLFCSSCSGWEGPARYSDPPASTSAPCAATADELSASAAYQGVSCAPAFASGVNVAWLSFASDIPEPSLCGFRSIFANTEAAGGRIVRWWLHTDGSVTPGYDIDGFARPISESEIADVRSVLDVAQAAHVMLTLSLWSFDMLRTGPIEQNRRLLTDDEHRQAYIDNVLTPLAAALAGHPAVYAWEAFNEPEGMSHEFGWTRTKVSMADIQKTVNWFGNAVRRADARARFTNGCWSFRACSAVGSGQNYYSDAELLRVGGREKGTLDFYEVHYYTTNGADVSPFVNPAAHWNLDKPIVVGEFWATDSDGIARDDLFMQLFSTGYAGAWAWQYANADGDSGGMKRDYRWPAMQPGLQNLEAIAPESLDIVCD